MLKIIHFIFCFLYLFISCGFSTEIKFVKKQCIKLRETYLNCQEDSNFNCNNFLDEFKLYTINNNYYDLNSCIIKDLGEYLSFISKNNNIKTREFFASNEFRNTLDGIYYEQYYEESINAFKLLNKYKEANHRKLVIASIVSSSKLPDRKKISYSVKNIVDGNRSTAWVEGVNGAGLKEWIMISFDRPRTIEGFLIWNGYGKNNTTYKNNNRVKRLQISIFKKNSLFVKLKDINEYQTVPIKEKIYSKYLLIKIVDIYKGKKYNDTCISELNFKFEDPDLTIQHEYHFNFLPLCEVKYLKELEIQEQ